MPSKNTLKVSFVTSGTQKSRGFSVFAHIKLLPSAKGAVQPD